WSLHCSAASSGLCRGRGTAGGGAWFVRLECGGDCKTQQVTFPQSIRLGARESSVSKIIDPMDPDHELAWPRAILTEELTRQLRRRSTAVRNDRWLTHMKRLL